MTTLVLTRGMPGSGKTTWAQAWVAEAPQARVRMNRDDFRYMGFAEYVLQGNQEDAVTVAQHAAVEALLRAGRDVVVDDTNLSARGVKAWYKVADKAGATVEFHDMETHVDQAHVWNSNRVKKVAPEVIDRFYTRYYKKGKLPPVPDRGVVAAPGALYVPNKLLPRAWIFDVDGTLMHMDDRRGPFEWHNVHLDRADESTVRLLRLIQSADLGDDNHPDQVIILSGRDGSCRELTEQSLTLAGVTWDAMFMRQAGDMRKDNIIKLELFDEYIRNNYWVQGVIDDRNQVVSMWRSIGLKCYQAADGDF